ncbi:MAG: hypothetical protein KAR51_00125 [Candidatus Aenigmarchaeota archaeon]|nr:hypothetical protein [Candidatus Aenigmarchaeota archaeon]
MSLESKWLYKLENFLTSKGYTDIDKGLVVYGGKNNGTVDLKATNPTNKKSIIIEIKNNPLHLIDLSRYLVLKENIEKHNESKDEKLKFFLLTCEHEISSELKKLGKSKEVIIENLKEFIERDSF